MDNQKDFYISYAAGIKKDEKWAVWIASTLENAGYTTAVEAWDLRAGNNFVLYKNAALIKSERFIAVLSVNYFDALYASAEWGAALLKDANLEKSLFIPVRVDGIQPVGVFEKINYIDLYGADGNEAAKLLIDWVSFDSVRNIIGKPGTKSPKYPGEMPLNNLPHSRNPYFTGRDEKLDLIYENFRSGERLSLTQSVTGLGGVGKTAIALEYSYSHSYKYNVIWWVNAETSITALTSYRAFALKQKLITEEATEDKIIEAVRTWLDNNKKWLFIYDNTDADDYVKWFESYLPQSNRGHILITTRSSHFPQSKLIDITVFNENEAITFLKKRTNKNGIGYSGDLAKKLAERLQYLPLALEQAAAYIVETPEVTYQDYIELIDECSADIFIQKNYLVDYHSTINITWKISMEKIKKQSALQILNMCSYFAPDKIPVDIFVRGKELLPEQLQSDIGDDITRNEILTDLTRYSLVSWGKDNNMLSDEKRILNMHRILQEVVQKSLDGDTVWLRYCLNLINITFDFEFGNTKSMYVFEASVPHAVKISEISKKIFNDNNSLELTAEIFNRCGKGFLYLGKYETSKELLNKSSKIYENLEYNQSRNLGVVYNNLGSVLNKLGKYNEALEFFNKSLKIYKYINEISTDLATCYTNIGLLYNDLQKYKKALKFCTKDLEICEDILGQNHPDTAKSYANIGLIYYNLQDYEKALSFYNKDLEICENILGKNHPDTAKSYINIGSIYSEWMEYEYALKFYKKALKIFEEICGNEHPDTAKCYDSIGIVYKKLNKFNHALKFSNKALKIHEKIKSSENIDFAICCNNVGTIYNELGQYKKALSLYKKALKIRENYGAESSGILECYNNIGVVYNDLGEYTEALFFLNKALKLYKKINSSNNKYIGSCYNNLGLVYKNLGNYKKSLYYYNEDLKICKVREEHNSLNIAICYNNIGSVYDDLGEYIKALEYYNKDLEICERILGKEHPDVATSYNNIALAYYNLNEYEESIKYNNIALNIRENILGTSHPDTAQSYNNIGLAYEYLKKYNIALEFYNKALKIWEKVLGNNHLNIITVLENIESCKEKQKIS